VTRPAASWSRLLIKATRDVEGSEANMAKVEYEVRVLGQVGPAAREAFADVAVEVEPPATVLTGEMDQAALHGLLERIQALGLEIVVIRRV
jgi:hypothetical protein